MTHVKCPTCSKVIEWSDSYPNRPFCCERCKLIDLGNWANGTYAIPAVESASSADLDAAENMIAAEDLEAGLDIWLDVNDAADDDDMAEQDTEQRREN